MKVSRDQLNDVRKPVLANGSNNFYWNLIVDILAIPLVGDLASLNSFLVCALRVH
jgi:hypothetical protein